MIGTKDSAEDANEAERQWASELDFRLAVMAKRLQDVRALVSWQGELESEIKRLDEIEDRQRSGR